MSPKREHSFLEIRCVRPSDHHALSVFFATISKTEDSRFFHPHPFTKEQALSICYYKGQDLYYILHTGTKIIGYGILRGWDEGFDIPSLGIVIHPEERGKGYGDLLMRFLHAAARIRGATHVRLKVYPNNKTAIGMYRKLGYKFEGKEETQIVGVIEL